MSFGRLCLSRRLLTCLNVVLRKLSGCFRLLTIIFGLCTLMYVGVEVLLKWIKESLHFGNSLTRILLSSDLNFLQFNARWIMVHMIIGLGWIERFLIRRTRTKLIEVLQWL
ncbi:unnamed protein product [Brassica napus]|nr:unnamed protein product [Brassica napus]